MQMSTVSLSVQLHIAIFTSTAVTFTSSHIHYIYIQMYESQVGWGCRTHYISAED